MTDPIHELIDEIVTEFDLTEADAKLPAWQSSGLAISRTDVARLVFHIKRQDVYVDALLAGDGCERPSPESLATKRAQDEFWAEHPEVQS